MERLFPATDGTTGVDGEDSDDGRTAGKGPG
jgi:hypothetical protein